MKFAPIDPPRRYAVGRRIPHQISDCARIELQADEQVTFVTPAGAEYDVTRKAWGFYATPSLNGRLAGFGLRAALVRNPDQRYFIFLVERGREDEMTRYLDAEEQTLVRWLDTDEALQALDPSEKDGTGA